MKNWKFCPNCGIKLDYLSPFKDGELVVSNNKILGVVISKPNKGMLGKVRWVQESKIYNMAEIDWSKLAINSHFITKCPDDIYPSGRGSFLVISDSERPAKAGELYLEGLGKVGKATHDWQEGVTAWIVVPCDLACYTQTFNRIAYVMYERRGKADLLMTSKGKEVHHYPATAGGITGDWINSMNLKSVPLSVSAITGIVTPEGDK